MVTSKNSLKFFAARTARSWKDDVAGNHLCAASLSLSVFSLTVKMFLDEPPRWVRDAQLLQTSKVVQPMHLSIYPILGAAMITTPCLAETAGMSCSSLCLQGSWKEKIPRGFLAEQGYHNPCVRQKG